MTREDLKLLTDIRDFTASPPNGHSFLCENRLFKRVSLLIFVIREKEIFISVIHDPQFFRFVNRARETPSGLYDPHKRRESSNK